jgi:hypothetical protein
VGGYAETADFPLGFFVRQVVHIYSFGRRLIDGIIFAISAAASTLQLPYQT